MGEHTHSDTAATRPDFVVPKAAQILAQSLKTDILSGRVAPGQSLPSPDDLARTYQLSRPTVREALNLLESQGLVRLKRGPKGGAIVQQPDHRAVTRALADLLEYERVAFQHIIEVRQILEPSAASIAACRSTPAELKAFETSVEEMAAHIEDTAAWMALGISFHRLIFHASKNPVLGAFMDSMTYLMRTAQRPGTPLNQRADVVEEHRAVVESVAAHDAKAAEAAMANHIRRLSDRRLPPNRRGSTTDPHWFD